MKTSESKFWDKVFKAGAHIGVINPTLRTWKSRGWVPPNRHYELIEAAPKVGTKLTIKDLNQVWKQ